MGDVDGAKFTCDLEIFCQITEHNSLSAVRFKYRGQIIFVNLVEEKKIFFLTINKPKDKFTFTNVKSTKTQKTGTLGQVCIFYPRWN